MAIQPMQRLQNVTASLEVYLQTTLVTLDSVIVGFWGVPLDTRSVSSWVQVNFLDHFSGAKYRNVGSSVHGAEQRFMIQVSCFARTNVLATGVPLSRATLFSLRDKVIGRLHLGKEIPVVDYANNGTATVDTLLVADLEEKSMARARTTSTAVDLDSGLNSWVVTLTLRYVHPHAST